MELKYNIGEVVSYKHSSLGSQGCVTRYGIGFVEEIVLTNASPRYVVDDIRLMECHITNLYAIVENEE